eukprot:gene4391-58480_t
MRLEQKGYYDVDVQLGDAIADRPRKDVLCFSEHDTLGAVAEHLGSSGVCGHLSVTHVFDWLMRHDEESGDTPTTPPAP